MRSLENEREKSFPSAYSEFTAIFRIYTKMIRYSRNSTVRFTIIICGVPCVSVDLIQISVSKGCHVTFDVLTVLKTDFMVLLIVAT
jgi:hypothetical protein